MSHQSTYDNKKCSGSSSIDYCNDGSSSSIDKVIVIMMIVVTAILIRLL